MRVFEPGIFPSSGSTDDKLGWLYQQIQEISRASHEDVVTPDDLKNRGIEYASKAAVEAARIPAAALFLRTAGYYAAGDGGGALYARASGEPSHPGKIQSLDGAWWELATDDIDLRMLGSDGTAANDNAAANSVRQIMEVTPGTRMWIPPYTVLINKDTALFFQGGGAIEVRGYGRDRSVIKAADGANLTTVIATVNTGAVTSFKMQDVGIDGNRTNTGTALSPSYFVYLQCLDVEIARCSFTEIQATGITLFPLADTSTADYVRVYDCDFDGVGQAFDNGNNIGVGISGIAHRLHVSRCHFKNFHALVTPNKDVAAINVATDKEYIVTDCTLREIYNISGGMFSCNDGGDGSTVIRGIIANVTCENTSSYDNDATSAFEVSASGVIIANCTARGVRRNGIVVESKSSRLLIANNNISNFGTDGAGTAAGILFIEGVNKALVHGNVISEGPNGILLGNDGTGFDRFVDTNYIDALTVTTPISVSNIWLVNDNIGATNCVLVSALPTAATHPGHRAVVSDANATTFRAVVAGGGANFVPVFSDGTNWRIG